MSLKRAREARERKVKRLIKRAKSTRTSVNITQGGVPGANAYVPRSLYAAPPELKYFDINLSTGTGTSWQILSNQSLCSIVQGTGASQRIGRKIRVKGVVFRGTSTLGVSTNNAWNPYTIDFIWDKQCNGASPVIGSIYVNGAAQNLPNPENDERFVWQKRYAKNDPNSNFQLIDTSFKCNKLITYDGSTGSLTDLTSTNLLVTYVCPFDADPTLVAVMRILFIDE
jgi:hypothetical protein